MHEEKKMKQKVEDSQQGNVNLLPIFPHVLQYKDAWGKENQTEGGGHGTRGQGAKLPAGQTGASQSQNPLQHDQAEKERESGKKVTDHTVIFNLFFSLFCFDGCSLCAVSFSYIQEDVLCISHVQEEAWSS